MGSGCLVACGVAYDVPGSLRNLPSQLEIPTRRGVAVPSKRRQPNAKAESFTSGIELCDPAALRHQQQLCSDFEIIGRPSSLTTSVVELR